MGKQGEFTDHWPTRRLRVQRGHVVTDASCSTLSTVMHYCLPIGQFVKN